MQYRIRFTLFLLLMVAFCPAQLVSSNPNSWWTGGVSVENHSMHVVIKNGYADVEEEAVLRATTTNSGSIATSTPLELHGNLNVAAGTSVVGMFLWSGNSILKAKLKPMTTATSQYEAIVDRTASPPPQPRDPALLTRIADNTYSLSIYPVVVNDARKVRLRYLVPFSVSSNGASIPLNPIFSGNASISVEASEYKSITALRNSVRTSYDLPFTLSNQETSTFEVELGNVNDASSLRTSFNSGDYQGHYWRLTQPVPDSIIVRAGLRREVVILWKWNFPEYYLNKDNSISDFGAEAVEQARMIEQLVETQTGNSDQVFFGLVHQTRADSIRQVGLGNFGSPNLLVLKNYLAQINNSNLVNIVPPAYSSKKASDKDLLKIKQRSQADFDSLVLRSVSLYSPTDGVIKHLIILTAGPKMSIQTPGLQDIQTMAKLTGISVTTPSLPSAAEGTGWFGVDLAAVAKDLAYQGTMTPTTILSGQCADYYCSSYKYQTSYSVPQEKNLHFSATVNMGGINQIFEFPGLRGSMLQFAVHSVNPVDSFVNWRAYDETGAKIAEYGQTIRSIGAPEDSGVAKIVAADLNMTDELYPISEVGAAFGVVRKDYALVALESDSIGASVSLEFLAGGLPYLTSAEIFKPGVVANPDPTGITSNTSKALESLLGITSRLGGRVQFLVQGQLRSELQRAEILDLHGRLVAVLDVEMLRSNGALEWNGELMSKGIYYIRLTSNSTQLAKQFVIR